MTEMQAQSARAIGQAVVECGKDCLSHEDLVLVAKAFQQVCVRVCMFVCGFMFAQRERKSMQMTACHMRTLCWWPRPLSRYVCVYVCSSVGLCLQSER